MYAYLYAVPFNETGYVISRVSYPEWSMYSTLYPTDEQVKQAIQRVRKDFPIHSFSLMRRDYLFETERVVTFVEEETGVAVRSYAHGDTFPNESELSI